MLIVLDTASLALACLPIVACFLNMAALSTGSQTDATGINLKAKGESNRAIHALSQALAYLEPPNAWLTRWALSLAYPPAHSSRHRSPHPDNFCLHHSVVFKFLPSVRAISKTTWLIKSCDFLFIHRQVLHYHTTPKTGAANTVMRLVFHPGR